MTTGAQTPAIKSSPALAAKSASQSTPPQIAAKQAEAKLNPTQKQAVSLLQAVESDLSR